MSSLYLNPLNLTKEEFLDTFGTLLTNPPATYLDGHTIAVCLVENPEFTAARVAVTQEDLIATYATPQDQRPRKYYYVPMDAIAPPHFSWSVKDFMR